MADDTARKLRFRPSAGTMAALGLKEIKSDSPPTTAYIMLGEKCVRDCSFCAQAVHSTSGAGRLSRVTWPEADEDALSESLGKATADGSIRRVCIQTVGGRGALDVVCEAVAKLRAVCGPGTAFSVSFSATAGLDDIGRILASGANRVALAIDACNPELHKKIKKADMAASRALIKKAALSFPGRISTHLIAGMGETEEELLRLASSLKEEGVGLGLFAFTPLRGTAMENHPIPEMTSYRRVQLAFWMIKKGLLKEGMMSFDGSGRLSYIGMSRSEVERLALKGEPFRTSGCEWCNRPYYNERPGTELYNYPGPLSGEEAAMAFAKAVKGLVFAGEEGR